MKKGFITIILALIICFSLYSQEQQEAMGLEALPSALNQSMPQAQPKGIITDNNSIPGDGIESIKLPPKVDLSDFLPPVRSQGAIGSCSAWSTVYYAKTIQENQERMWGADIPEHQYSPLFTYNQITGGVNKGTSIIEHMILIEKQGVPTLHDFPHTDNINILPDINILAEAMNYKSTSHKKLDQYDYKNKTWSVDMQTVKTALAEGFPVVGGFTIYENFHSYKGGVYDNPEGTISGGHAMCIVGYDDNIGAFRIVNSWGTWWGEKGFIWLSYDIFEKLCVSGCAIMVDIIDTAPDVIPAPVEISGTKGVHSDRIELTWKGSENVNFYIIYRVNNEEGVLEEIARTTENYYLDDSLPPGVSYIYAVKSGRNKYSKDFISKFSEITEGWTMEEKTVPGIPSGLEYTYFKGNPLLVWEPVENTLGYNIYRWSKQKEEFLKIGSSSDTTYMDRSFDLITEAGIIYYIVEAFNDLGPGFATDNLSILKEITPSPPEKEIIISGEISDDKVTSVSSQTVFTGNYYRTDFFDYEYTMAQFKEYYKKEMEAFHNFQEEEKSSFEDWKKQQDDALKNSN
jgi:C1A family cysteine protease